MRVTSGELSADQATSNHPQVVYRQRDNLVNRGEASECLAVTCSRIALHGEVLEQADPHGDVAKLPPDLRELLLTALAPAP